MKKYEIRQETEGPNAGKWFAYTNGIKAGCCSYCEGHGTPEEATRHYREWELTTHLWSSAVPDGPGKCVVCGKEADSQACVGQPPTTYPLCKLHFKYEVVERLYLDQDEPSP